MSSAAPSRPPPPPRPRSPRTRTAPPTRSGRAPPSGRAAARHWGLLPRSRAAAPSRTCRHRAPSAATAATARACSSRAQRCARAARRWRFPPPRATARACSLRPRTRAARRPAGTAARRCQARAAPPSTRRPAVHTHTGTHRHASARTPPPPAVIQRRHSSAPAPPPPRRRAAPRLGPVDVDEQDITSGRPKRHPRHAGAARCDARERGPLRAPRRGGRGGACGSTTLCHVRPKPPQRRAH